MDRFRLVVAEKLPGVHDQAGPDEIIQDRVIFERELIVDPYLSKSEPGVETIASPSYPYPASGAWSLEAGKTYYWQLIGLVGGASQEIELPSEIWTFHVTGINESSEYQQLLQLLSTLPQDDISALFAHNGLLEGYDPSGSFFVNGQPISLDAVIQILLKVQSGDYQFVGTICE